MSVDENDIKQLIVNAEKAYQLGPELGQSNLVKGYVHFRNGEYDQAFAKYRIALEKAPNDYAVQHGIGWSYYIIGLYREAIPFFQKAVELAPFFLWSKINLAWCAMVARRAREGGTLFEGSAGPQSQEPLLPPLSRGPSGDTPGKSTRPKSSSMSSPGSPPGSFNCRQVGRSLSAARGEKDKALELYESSVVYALLGMKDEAIGFMQKSLSKGGSYNYLSLIGQPYYKALRGDPRFEKIVAQAKKTYDELSSKYGSILQGNRP